jgi:hypothetical protein
VLKVSPGKTIPKKKILTYSLSKVMFRLPKNLYFLFINCMLVPNNSSHRNIVWYGACIEESFSNFMVEV